MRVVLFATSKIDREVNDVLRSCSAERRVFQPAHLRLRERPDFAVAQDDHPERVVLLAVVDQRHGASGLAARRHPDRDRRR
jgi:hypothetical protein